MSNNNPNALRQSIRTALKRRILFDVFIKCVKKTKAGAMVLVLDDQTSRIVSSCMRMNDLIDNGILAVENINRTREPLKNYAALYFLSTTPESIDLVIKDFTSTKDKPKYQMYQSAWIFFTTAVPDGLMTKIENSSLVDYIEALQEINIDFNTIEARVFSLGSPLKVPVYYWGQRELLEFRLKTDSFKLVSLFLTLNDCPAVRYDASSKLATKFASLFHSNLNSIRKNSQWEPNTRGCVLIVDRAIDLITPLIHDFTYQSLVYDLCGNNNGEIVYLNNETWKPANAAEEEKKTLILHDVEDPVWSQQRHGHIGTVASRITSNLKAFKKDNKMAQWEERKAKDKDRGREETQLSPKDMAAALRDFAEYQKTVSKYTRHLDLAKECLVKIDARKLKEIATLEQELTTGFTADGDKISLKNCIKVLKSICLNRSVGVEDKVRLILLYLITQGSLGESVIDQLLDGHSKVDPHVKAVIYNIDKLLPHDLRIFGNNNYQGPAYSNVRRREGEARSEKIQFLRYIPVLWELGHLWVLNKLGEDRFKYCDQNTRFNPTTAFAGTSGGAKGKRGTKAQVTSDSTGEVIELNNKPYMVVFVLGGMTMSEMRSIYEIADEHQVNIIIGGSEVLTPRTFLCNLGNCTQEAWNDYCGPQNLAGARVSGETQLFTTTFTHIQNSKTKSLIDIEKIEIERLEGVKLEREEDIKKDTKKKPTRFHKSGDSDDDDDIPEMDF